MARLIRGRIVFSRIAVPDPQGRNPKLNRPFVVISRDEEIKNGDRVQAVGITGELHASPNSDYVLLPYGPNAKTGLKQKSAALCTWLIDVSQADVEVGKGYVRPDLVEKIVQEVLRLKSIARIVDLDPDGSGD